MGFNKPFKYLFYGKCDNLVMKGNNRKEGREWEKVHIHRSLSYKFAANCFLLLKKRNDAIDHQQELRIA